MLGNVLSGEISEMVLALRDHNVKRTVGNETTYNQLQTDSCHTDLYKTQQLMDARLKTEPQNFGLLVPEGDGGLSPTLSTSQQLLFSKW